MTHRLRYWLAALHLPEVGPRTLMRWLQHFHHIEHLFRATEDEWQAANIPAKHILSIKQINWLTIDNELKWADDPEHHILSLEDADYPCLLKEISDPPIVLYVQGNKKVLTHSQIAMVGTRKASVVGSEIAEQLAQSLVKAGLTITSGLALGIDRASHEGALMAKGLTIGVAGTGLKHIYPHSNGPLITKILTSGGAVISEFPLSTPPRAMNFPRRNRIISGLSIGVLVVEAALKSGSLITARHALEQGREVFAIPGSIYHTLSKGCHYLIQQGAKLVETVSDILDELGTMRSFPVDTCLISDSLDNKLKLNTEEQAVYERINYEITPLDVIILRSGLTAGKVSSILLRLELHGHIHSVSGGYIRVITK